MPSIDLSLISSSTKDRANGYIEEILKRGKIVGSYVELSDSDYNYIKNNFSLSKSNKSNIGMSFISPEAKIEQPQPADNTISQKLTRISGLAN